MAFNRDGWIPIGGQSKKGTAPQVFSYTTADAVADVNTEDVAVGDVIIAVTSTGGTLASSLHTVASNAAGVVDVTDGTTIAQTDTD